jgi:hypothetical protein
MNRTIRLHDVCEFENGKVKSIDLSKVYTLRKEDGRAKSRPAPSAGKVHTIMKAAQQRPIDLSLVLGPLFAQAAGTSRALAQSHPPALLQTAALETEPGLVARSSRKTGSAVKLQPLETRTYSVNESRESVLREMPGRKEVTFEIPLGMPRFVNAATLKAMLDADAGSSDVLFRKAGSRWEICPDSFQVDLQDRAQVFRLGEIQIYS